MFCFVERLSRCTYQSLSTALWNAAPISLQDRKLVSRLYPAVDLTTQDKDVSRDYRCPTNRVRRKSFQWDRHLFPVQDLIIIFHSYQALSLTAAFRY